MAFDSKLHLPISENPLSNSKETWNDFVDIYNSIHLLNQAYSQLSDQLGNFGNKTADDPLVDQLPYKTWIWVQASEDIPKGTPVAVVNSSAHTASGDQNFVGLYKGMGMMGGARDNTYSYGNVGSGGQPSGGGFLGLSLNDAASGAFCQIGIGPAIVNVPGVHTGDIIMAGNTFTGKSRAAGGDGIIHFNDGRGQFHNYNEANSSVVGWGVGEDALYIPNFPGDLRNLMIDYYAVAPDTGGSGGGT